MKRPKSLAVAAAVAASAAILSAPGAGSAATAGPSPDPAVPDASPAPVAGQVVTPKHSRNEVKVLARTNGRTTAEQRAVLERQDRSNNTAARLQAAGHDFDGLFVDARGRLVVQAAKGSSGARAAEAAGARVRDPKFGEQALSSIQQELSGLPLDGVSSLGVDVRADRVVVTRSGSLSSELRSAIDKHADAITVVRGPSNQQTAGVDGGDELRLNGGGVWCSAGFPAHNDSGDRLMIWVGHCSEDSQTFTTPNGNRIGTFAASEYGSYDGQMDRDIGAVLLDDEDSLSTAVNRYGTNRDLDAERGAYKPPVGTEFCRSGATSGVTCGEITSYNQRVTYVDNDDNVVADVTGLAKTTACVLGGDSGGPYTTGGYAIGMASGGPKDQSGCNGQPTYSYMQPVTDALDYYGYTYN